MAHECTAWGPESTYELRNEILRRLDVWGATDQDGYQTSADAMESFHRDAD